MRIFAHRTNDPAKWNLLAASGFGLEVDVRMRGGKLVLCHDPDEHGASIDVLVSFLKSHPDTHVLLDVKEDNTIDAIADAISDVKSQCIVIDAIVPDMFRAIWHGIKTLGRKSKYESTCVPGQHGAWLDYVFDRNELVRLPSVYLVSPELHGRMLGQTYIDQAKSYGIAGVCTDVPERWV